MLFRALRLLSTRSNELIVSIPPHNRALARLQPKLVLGKVQSKFAFIHAQFQERQRWSDFNDCVLYQIESLYLQKVGETEGAAKDSLQLVLL